MDSLRSKVPAPFELGRESQSHSDGEDTTTCSNRKSADGFAVTAHHLPGSLGFIGSCAVTLLVLLLLTSDLSSPQPSLFLLLRSPHQQWEHWSMAQRLGISAYLHPSLVQDLLSNLVGSTQPSIPDLDLDVQDPVTTVPLTVLPEGAGQYQDGVCLDGTPPAYHIDRGIGEGDSKWVLFLQEGAWCASESECAARANTELGSSKKMPQVMEFEGILSPREAENPLFWNWTRVYIRYCDGGSFSGTAGSLKEGLLHLQGQAVFLRVMSHLLTAQGLSRATHSLLAGHSAGGLAAMLHCDLFWNILENKTMSSRRLNGSNSTPPDSQQHGSSIRATSRDDSLNTSSELPREAHASSAKETRRLQAQGPAYTSRGGSGGGSSQVVVKCMSDAGFFPDVLDFYGGAKLRDLFREVVALHKPVLNPTCLGNAKRMDSRNSSSPSDSSTCFFPEQFLRFSRTPVFILNSLYDSWMIKSILLPKPLRSQRWRACREDLFQCSMHQMHRFHAYRHELVSRVQQLAKGVEGSGAFLFSCRVHSVAMHGRQWHGPESVRVNGVTFAEAVGQWFTGATNRTLQVDCGFPCNPTCSPNAM